MESNVFAKIKHTWEIECVRDGKVIWTEKFDNLVVTEGLNKYLDATIVTGLAAPAWYIGLKDTGAMNAADTLAVPVNWTELTNYSGNRKTYVPGAISGGSVNNSASKASFAITGDDTVYGAFMCSVATGTAGTLLGGDDFGTPRAVLIGDTLNVQVTLTITP